MNSVTVAAQGHPNIRVTHHKTLELTDAESITQRATCIAGVDARVDAARLRSLRGPVALELRVNEHRVSGEATINPYYGGAPSLVIRNSSHTDADTLAVRSTLAARDIPSAMAQALAEPEARVTLTITEIEPAPPLVLVGEPPVGPNQHRFLWDHADERLDFERFRPNGPPRGVVAVSLGSEAAQRRALAWVAEAGAQGVRVAIADGGPAAVFLAAGFEPAPALWLGDLDGAGLARLRDALPVTMFPVGFRFPASVYDDVLTIVRDSGRRAVISDGRFDVGVGMEWAAGEQVDDDVVMVLAPEPSSERQLGLSTVVKALTAVDVSAKTLGQALAPHGIGKREIYRIVRDLENGEG